MLLRDHPGMDVPAAPRTQPDGAGVRQTDRAQGRNGGAGQQAPPAGHERKRDRMIQPSSELARIHADMRERYEQAADKERYTEIRLHLDCTQLLARLRHSHGLDAALYPVSMATDGTPRIACGTRSLTPSDFLTKEMGLPWREAAPILREVYALQIGKQVTRARDKPPSAQLWQVAEQMAENPDLTLGAQAKTLAGLSGTARKSAPSLEKLRVAKDKAKLMEKHLELRPPIQPIPPIQAQARQLFPQSRAQAGSEAALVALRELENTARATPVQAAISGTIAFGHDQAEKKRRRRARESSAALLRALTHHVELNGDITYSKDGRAVFRDEGLRIVVLDQNDEDVIAAALLIAREKFSQDLTLTGPPEFQQRVIAVAVARGIPVKFVDPALEALRLQLLDDKRQAAAPAQTPLKVQDTGEDAAGLQQVAPVLLPETPPVDSQEEERYARQIAFAQDQGFNVERAVEGKQYLGKILQVTDQFVVHKVGRHTAVIHRVDQLQGSYTVGQTARIQYREGIGMDESEQLGSSGQER